MNAHKHLLCKFKPPPTCFVNQICFFSPFLALTHHNNPSHRHPPPPPTPRKLPAILPSPSISLKHLWQLMFKSGVAWPQCSLLWWERPGQRLSLNLSNTHTHTQTHTCTTQYHKHIKMKILGKVRRRERQTNRSDLNMLKENKWSVKKATKQALHLSGFIIKYLSSFIFHEDARLVKQYLLGLFLWLLVKEIKSCFKMVCGWWKNRPYPNQI